MTPWRYGVLPLMHPAPGTASPPADPAALLTSWLGSAGDGEGKPRLLRLADGRLMPLPVARWTGPVSSADETMLARASGPVLDVGCGPGRLTAALHARGVDVLGLELLPDVPVLARRAGAPLLLGDVFADVPRAGRWRTALLADGNVGIGGDAVRLLRRVRDLLAPDGRIVCELHADDDDTAGPVRLEGVGATSAWFPWTLLGTGGLAAAAPSAGLAVADAWEADGRQFAELHRV
jgi:SAM-dependent methyltransferase